MRRMASDMASGREPEFRNLPKFSEPERIVDGWLVCESRRSIISRTSHGLAFGGAPRSLLIWIIFTALIDTIGDESAD